MPRAQLSWPQYGINKTVGLPSPTKITDMRAWVSHIGKYIPQTPSLKGGHWFIAHEIITEKSIMLQLEDRFGHRCSIVVDRKFNHMAGR